MQDHTGKRERRIRIEAVTLALLVALPFLPYFVYLARSGIPRFSVEGDYAGLELATRYVASGKTLLGPYSRFGFSHPGPLYFYWIAPIYALSGSTSTGLFAAACSLNVASSVIAVVATRVFTTLAHAVSVSVVLLAWMGAFGNASALPWNPLVVVLPLVAFLVLVALAARGHTLALPPAALFGALAAQTHLATVPTVLAAALGVLIVVKLRMRSTGRLPPRERRHLFAALLVGAVASVPPLLEQVISPEGNLRKLARFFVARTAPLHSFETAIRDWAFATSWLGDRLVSRSIIADGSITAVMVSTPAPPHLSTTAGRLALLLVVAAVIAGFVAYRRRDRASVALLGTGALAAALSLVALRGIVGPDYVYLLFWTTAATSVLWMGVMATFATGASALVLQTWPRTARAAPVVGLVVVALAATAVTAWQAEYVRENRIEPVENPPMKTLYDGLRNRLAERGETPVVHAAGSWHLGTMLLLELTKDGVDARVVARDRWLFGRQPRGADGAQRPLHVYVRALDRPLDLSPCLVRLAVSGNIEFLVSDHDVERCEEDPPGR